MAEHISDAQLAEVRRLIRNARNEVTIPRSHWTAYAADCSVLLDEIDLLTAERDAAATEAEAYKQESREVIEFLLAWMDGGYDITHVPYEDVERIVERGRALVAKEEIR